MKKLGIYIHIPFCVKKCDYCDFLSAPSDCVQRALYVEALIKEIELSKKNMEEYLVDTVFIGGGTPSILDGEQIADVLHAFSFACKPQEITIEANPGTVTKEKLEAYKKSGINRISFGLQSANDKELKNIGRIHMYKDFTDSFYLARQCGFDNVNVDIMSALPGQTVRSFEETLEKVAALEPEHISAYSLIVEENTPMYERVEKAESEGKSILPDEISERKMYYITKDYLNSKGYSRYEISNYSKNGYECRHNIGYWQRKDYMGFGIGAASLVGDVRYKNIEDINEYIRMMKSDDTVNKSEESILKNIRTDIEELSMQDKMEEFMFLGLRMMKGISKDEFYKQFGVAFDSIYGNITKNLIDKKLLVQDGEIIRLSETGIDVSNYVMSEYMF